MTRHGFSAAQRIALRDRADGRCDICLLGVNGIAHAHHRQPRGMGGGLTVNRLSNALWLHPRCHMVRVERNRTESIAFGWLVPMGLEPSLTPVLLGQEWFLLSDDGGVWPTPPPGVG